MIFEFEHDIIVDFERYDNNSKGIAVVHCISADWKLGAGVAVPIKKYFGIPEFEYNPDNVGKCVKFESDKGVVYNLITKHRYNHKPTYQTLESALIDLKYRFDSNGIVMPRIGCGLDKLKWHKVKPMIESILDNIPIYVCDIRGYKRFGSMDMRNVYPQVLP